jgi:plastocyanin
MMLKGSRPFGQLLSLRMGLLLTGALVLFSGLARATTWEVQMGTDDRFHPDALTIAVGDSVFWRNVDTDDHTSTSGTPDCTPDGLWDSGDVLPGQTWGLRFESLGTFQYLCLHHCPFGMVGTVTVQEETPADATSWADIKALFR